jgi:hypothetical protein
MRDTKVVKRLYTIEPFGLRPCFSTDSLHDSQLNPLLLWTMPYLQMRITITTITIYPTYSIVFFFLINIMETNPEHYKHQRFDYYHYSLDPKELHSINPTSFSLSPFISGFISFLIQLCFCDPSLQSFPCFFFHSFYLPGKTITSSYV